MKTCSIDGCDNAHLALGFCKKHYQRYRKHGDPMYLRPISDPICSIEGCDRKHHGHGYCKFHNKRFRKHGDPLFRLTENHNKTGTHIYITWTNMKRRCSNVKGWDYKYYGGRGIKVCDRWLHSFETFYTDMGDKPFPKAQIDRIDNDGNYEPSNCRWVTPKENSNNRRTENMGGNHGR